MSLSNVIQILHIYTNNNKIKGGYMRILVKNIICIFICLVAVMLGTTISESNFKQKRDIQIQISSGNDDIIILPRTIWNEDLI